MILTKLTTVNLFAKISLISKNDSTLKIKEKSATKEGYKTICIPRRVISGGEKNTPRLQVRMPAITVIAITGRKLKLCETIENFINRFEYIALIIKPIQLKTTTPASKTFIP